MSHCDICEVEIPPGEEAKEAHETGKRHIKLRAQKESAQLLQESSIFVKWKSRVPVTEEQLNGIFSEFGQIERILLRGERSFAIVEFGDPAAAEQALQVAQVSLPDGMLSIEKRKIEFTPQEAIRPQITVDQVSNALALTPTFSEQADNLIQLIVLSEKQLHSRLSYMKQLQQGLSEYLYNPEVVMFGSSITGIGTIDSDIDASVFVGTPPDFVPQLQRDKYTMLTCDPSLFKGRKVARQELLRLTPADRVRFVSKIINEVRKTAGWIGHQRPVLDARCPVVRFNIFKSCLIDLSVENQLGVRKSMYLKSLIERETSGNLRWILISFRFWALSNGLLEPPANQHAGHFNAYILNFLVIYSFMEQGLLPTLSFRENTEAVGPWKVDFAVPEFDLSRVDPALFFKEFFVKCVNLHFSECVLGANETVFMPKDVFQQNLLNEEIYKPFKLSCLNVQDPLERSHNIGQNVTEKMLATMKKHMMFSLSAMKKTKIVRLTDILSLSSRPNSPAEEAPLTADHQFRFPDAANLNLPGLKNVVTTILDEVMLWDLKNMNEPNFKRMKIDECPFQDENLHQWQSGNYSIRFPLWIGRRNIKRKIHHEKPALNGLELEKQVSEELVKTFPKADGLAVVNMIVQMQDSNTAILALKRVGGSPAEVTNAWHFVTMLISNNWSHIVTLI